MNALLWIVVPAVGIIVFVLVPFFALSYLLATRPHSKKKTAEQARLDKRTGNTTTSTDATPEQKKEEDGNKLWEWTRKNFWLILLVLAGVIVFFYGKSPDLADTGSWSRNHWLLILILWGIVATIIAINAGKAAKTLQTILAVIVFALFIGFPIIGRLADSGSHKKHHLVEIQTLSMPANGDSPHISAPVGYAPAFTGTDNGFTTHYVYADGTIGTVGDPTSPHHDGNILYYYVHDKTGKPNSVTYEFVKPK